MGNNLKLACHMLTVSDKDEAKCTFEFHGVQIVILRHRGEDFLLDGHRLELYPVENGRVEDVHASIDLVRHKFRRLLNKPVNTAVLRRVDDHAILARLINLRHLYTHQMRIGTPQFRF